MKQITFDLIDSELINFDYGWFATRPFFKYEHALNLYKELKLTWAETQLINKGNDWIVCYRNGGNRMIINRWNADFGNSICQQMINGTYFEIPSSIYEISEKEALSTFSEGVDQESLINQIVIKTKIDDEDKYFKVGEKAKNAVLSDSHILKLHDKTESQTVFVLWLAGLAFYHAYTFPTLPVSNQVNEITVKSFKTLLPIWLIKRAGRFTEMLEKMEDRFRGSFEVELLTPNFERKILFQVENCKCRIEGETARFALLYDLELNEKESSKKFRDARAVIDDLGGQTEDLVKLRPGLKRPENADDFQSFTDQSFLKMLENLRTTKLMTHFTDLRSLEQFVTKNIVEKKFTFIDPTTQKEEDFTGFINDAIREFIKISTNKLLNTFTFLPGEKVYYIHIGGVNELLESYKEEYLVELLGEQIVRNYHIFPEEARKLNIYSLEIVTKSELKKRDDHEEKEATI